MTVSECMAVADAIRPNGVSAEVKRRWIGELEGRVRVELHGEAPAAVSAAGDGAEGGTERELCVPHPFDRVYWLYVASMVEYLRGDTARYEMAAGLFNSAYLAYAKWLRREGA